MTETPVQPAKRQKWARSRVGNGGKLLPLTDGRSATSRRFQDLFEDIGADLGGLAGLSEAKKQLIRRASLLSAEGERQEALWANGLAEFNPEFYIVLSNCLRRILETLGTERVARDVTPTLESYLAAKVENA